MTQVIVILGEKYYSLFGKECDSQLIKENITSLIQLFHYKYRHSIKIIFEKDMGKNLPAKKPQDWNYLTIIAKNQKPIKRYLDDNILFRECVGKNQLENVNFFDSLLELVMGLSKQYEKDDIEISDNLLFRLEKFAIHIEEVVSDGNEPCFKFLAKITEKEQETK